MILTKRWRLLLLAAGGIATGFAAVLTTAGFGQTNDPSVESVNRSVTVPMTAAYDLASAVQRWDTEITNATDKFGSPELTRATILFEHVGRSGDSLTEFPTSNGSTCIALQAGEQSSGTCNRPERTGGIVWAVYSDPNGVRLVGSASPYVKSIAANITGASAIDVPINTARGFYLELEPGQQQESIATVTVVWTDGSSHSVPVFG